MTLSKDVLFSVSWQGPMWTGQKELRLTVSVADDPRFPELFAQVSQGMNLTSVLLPLTSCGEHRITSGDEARHAACFRLRCSLVALRALQITIHSFHDVEVAIPPLPDRGGDRYTLTIQQKREGEFSGSWAIVSLQREDIRNLTRLRQSVVDALFPNSHVSFSHGRCSRDMLTHLFVSIYATEAQACTWGPGPLMRGLSHEQRESQLTPVQRIWERFVLSSSVTPPSIATPPMHVASTLYYPSPGFVATWAAPVQGIAQTAEPLIRDSAYASGGLRILQGLVVRVTGAVCWAYKKIF